MLRLAGKYSRSQWQESDRRSALFSVSCVTSVIQTGTWLLLGDAELMHRGLVIGLTGLQQRGRKVGLVGRIGKVLRFQAESFVLLEATRAGRAAEMVAGVELHARLRREDFHDATALRINRPGRWAQRAGRSVDDETMVVALGLGKHVNALA